MKFIFIYIMSSLIVLIGIFSTCWVIIKSEISILGEGVGSVEEDDIAMLFYVTIKNICKDDLDISLNMIQCCETISSEEMDCNSMTLIGGDMGILGSSYTKNFTLIYPNLYLFNRQGVCTIGITYRNEFKKKEVTTDIRFDTRKHCPGKKILNQNECSTVDLDPLKNCNPVDCLIKYSGTISYFNSECKRCSKVPVCNSKTSGCFPDVAYSPYTNECVDLNIPISKKDLEEIESGQTSSNPVSMVNAICHYGTVTKNGECVCHQGWISSTNDEGIYEPGVAQHHFCNIQTGDWNCVNKNRIRITTILIAVFAITVVSKVLLLICVLSWCYKHFRKPDKICARELDPDDKSIILCENMDSFDQCLCTHSSEDIIFDPKQKKSTVLHSQTVNVSYYPCSPSAFSSMKASTRSSKSTTRTDQSIGIDLSNTTSTSAAISFPQGETSEEESEKSEDSYLANASNDISYGVYCGINEIAGEEEVEEEEEDEEEVENEIKDIMSSDINIDPRCGQGEE